MKNRVVRKINLITLIIRGGNDESEKKHLIRLAFVTLVICLGITQQAKAADYSIVDKNAYRTITTFYYADGRPYFRLRVNNFGPTNERRVETAINTSLTTKKITDTISDTGNYRKMEFHDANGNPYRYIKELNYGPIGQRHIEAAVTCNLSTGRYAKIVEVTSVETRQIDCNSYGLPYRVIKTKTTGPVYSRKITENCVYDVNTELIKSSIETSTLERRENTYATGLLTACKVSKNYGPVYGRVTNFVILCNTANAMPMKHTTSKKL